ncbi:MAG: penicillin-binding protein activator [candidate division WOR-3 bacterium]
MKRLCLDSNGWMRMQTDNRVSSVMVVSAFLFIMICFFSCAPLRARFTNIEERSAEYFEAGNKHFKAKEYEKAIVELEKVVRDYKGTEAYEPAFYLLIFSYHRINSFEKAVFYGEKFVKEFPYSNYLAKILGILGEANLKLVNDYKAAYYLIKFHKQSTDELEQESAYKKIMQLLSEMSVDNLDKLHRNFLGEPIDEHILYYLIKEEIKTGQEKNAERDFKVLTRRFPETVYAEEFTDFKRLAELGSASRKAGVLLPLTGKFARYGEKLKEILKIFDQKNSFSFSIILQDTKSDPVDAMLATANLVDEKKVDFIIGPLFSIEALGVAGYASARTVPVVIPTNIELKLNNLPLVFTPGQTMEQQARAIARYATRQLGYVRFAVLFPESGRYSNLAGIFVEEIKRNDGEVVAVESFDPDSVTLRYELERIKKKKPEALFLAMDTDMIINTAPQVSYYGLEDVKILGTDAFDNERIIRLGEKYVELAVFATSATMDSLALQDIKKQNLEINDPISVKFYQTLWALRELSDYERVNLGSKLAEVLLKQRNFAIWTIRNGEFVKLTEMKIE